MLHKPVSYFLLGLGVVLCISGAVSMIVLVDLLNFTLSNYQVWLAIGSVILGLLCLAIEFMLFGTKKGY